MSRGRLLVSLDWDDGQERRVAQLGWDPAARQVVAEWNPAFVADPLPLSPLLVRQPQALLRPRGRGFGDLPGLFGDSLPDGWGRLLIDRNLAARGRARSEITDLDRLAMVGTGGMGALVYRPEEAPDAAEDISLDWFDRLVPSIGEETSADDLDRLRAMAGGSQGARPKFVAQLSDDGTRLRDHRLTLLPGWRAVLVKRRAMTDAPGAAEAEAAYAAMARAAGIEMMPTGLLHARSGEAFFVTDRFDRVDGRRLHVQTVAALLDVDFRNATLDYAELLKLVRVMTRDQRAVEQMARRMVFNIRAQNRDDHLKNFAFIMGPDGAWRLAPAYDLSFSSGPGGEHTLTVAGEGRHPGMAQIHAVGAQSGIKSARIAEIINEVDAALLDWPRCAENAAVPTDLARRIAAALEAARAW
ncbi:type II toxin-antitoxin system HipA family toxin [Paracoccus sp. Ld10]|uniref:type II toxin-antitoxin system HipA family toxin n=1 Tax=Paracoccus sp. Ld10 TaxID=649158 RepID=UPI00386546CE